MCLMLRDRAMVDVVWNLRHDYFNLAVLPIICGVNLLYLFCGDGYYVTQYWMFLLYMAVDALWLVLIPQTVPSPVTIVAHHLVCLLGWNIPRFADGRYQNWLSLGLLVEINTWLLTARRNLPARNAVLEVLFYLTWVAFRVILYPVALVLFIGEFLAESEMRGTYLHPGLLLLCLMLLINGLNAKWSCDLVRKTFFKHPDKALARGL